MFLSKIHTSLPSSSGTVSWVCRAASQISTLTLEERQSGTTSCEEERSVSSIDINVWLPLVFQEKLPLHWETDICFQPCCHNRSKYDHGLTVCLAFQLYVNIVWKAHERLGSCFFFNVCIDPRFYTQPLDSAGVLADSTHTTESGDVWELGFIRKTGRHLLGG